MIPVTVVDLPVAGKPIYGAVFVPLATQRVVTQSPSATWLS